VTVQGLGGPVCLSVCVCMCVYVVVSVW
jgi:hypothetical protein